MARVSAVVLTKNEEKHITPCLESVRAFCDEMLVLDWESTDRTLNLARQLGARVELHPFENFASQRNAAIDLVRADWILYIDADERATPAFGLELRDRIERSETAFEAGQEGAIGFWVPRRNIILGKWMRHTGWSPDYQPRVLRKGCGHWDPAREVHELLLWDGPVGHMTEPLTHYNYETLAQFRAKQERYTRYEASILYQSGTRARARGLIGQPLREFWRRYVTLEGWKDGGHGLVLSALMGYYAFRRQKLLFALARSA